MTFTKDELDILSHALDIMARTEGQALGQVGIAGLKGERVILLTRKLKLGISALTKIEAMVAEIAEAEQRVADSTSEAE